MASLPALEGKPKDIPSLPWYRNATELPRPLPSRAEIEAATSVLPNIHREAFRRIVRVNDAFVVKYGPHVFENEGHSLLLVERLALVPAPRLYAMYREEKKLYIIMEFIEGQQLSEVWPTLNDDEKDSLARQLRLAFDHVRSMPSPGYYGGAFGGTVPHHYFFSPQGDPDVMGPFSRETDFCRALALRSIRNWEEIDRRGWMSEFFIRHAATVLNGHPSVFTHSDFQRKNVLVQRVPSLVKTSNPAEPTSANRQFELKGIVDWEMAGWYPSYWEYAISFAHFSWDDDWPEKVEKMLDPYIVESPLLRMIAHDLDA